MNPVNNELYTILYTKKSKNQPKKYKSVITNSLLVFYIYIYIYIYMMQYQDIINAETLKCT